jgi:hypothetical protein
VSIVLVGGVRSYRSRIRPDASLPLWRGGPSTLPRLTESRHAIAGPFAVAVIHSRLHRSCAPSGYNAALTQAMSLPHLRRDRAGFATFVCCKSGIVERGSVSSSVWTMWNRSILATEFRRLGN